MARHRRAWAIYNLAIWVAITVAGVAIVATV